MDWSHYAGMIRVCFCYDSNSELLKGAVQKVMSHYPEISFEAYNEDLYNERKKSYAVKGHFAARMTPFCGVFEDDNITKGFYTEAKECTEQNISEYMFATYAAIRIELPDTPDEEPKEFDLDTLINNYKQRSHGDD